MQTIGIGDLCPAARFYMVISFIAVFVMTFINFGTNTTFCYGFTQCTDRNHIVDILIKIMYILFWTWIANIICRKTSDSAAWIFVMFPFAVFIVITVILKGIS